MGCTYALRLFRAAVALLASMLPTSALPAGEQAKALPALAADITQTSVSGISSGAYMAGQFQIAHSKIVVGAAIIAGGPYGCADSAYSHFMPGPGASFLNLSKAMNGCMRDAMRKWGVPNPEALAAKTKRLADRGVIDPIGEVLTDRVYLFSGGLDETVAPSIVRAAADYYRALGIPPANIEFVSELSAGHGFVTEDSGLACGKSAEPFVIDCDYDQAGALLAHIYGTLKARAAAPAGQFLEFDQRPFVSGGPLHGLEASGEIYVPQQCATHTRCRIHVAFHGCSQSRAAVGDGFTRNTGFARWADSNDLVILFPQVAAGALNPQGCWDWWGYTGQNYLTRSAPQIKAVYRMVERLGAPRE